MNARDEDAKSSKDATTKTLLIVAAMVTAGLLAAGLLYVAPAPLPTLEQVRDMEKRCESFGYTSRQVANTFKQITDIECVDKSGNHISAKPDSRITIK